MLYRCSKLLRGITFSGPPPETMCPFPGHGLQNVPGHPLQFLCCSNTPGLWTLSSSWMSCTQPPASAWLMFQLRPSSFTLPEPRPPCAPTLRPDTPGALDVLGSGAYSAANG